MMNAQVIGYRRLNQNRGTSGKNGQVGHPLSVAFVKSRGTEDSPSGASNPVRRNGLLRQITELIEAHLDNEEYGINQLCRDAGLSRSKLHKKLKESTGLSASHFIRSIKLKKAQHLLLNSDLNIGQVAYELGFKDPTYFTKVFHMSFGLSPRKFRENRL